MADGKRSSQRYLSGRVKVTNNAGLGTDRHLYLNPSDAEPNLGFPGEKSIPLSGTYYRLITIPNGSVYDRYWQPDTPASLVNGISIFDEGVLVGTANSISKINFVGSAITATASGSISTVSVSPPGEDKQILFNKLGDFGAAPNLSYDYSNNRVGIGTTNPTQPLHIEGDFRLGGAVWDQHNIVGAAGSILISTGTGISWTSSVSANVTISPNAPTDAVQGDLWWDSEEGDLNVFYVDFDSGQWVSANANADQEDGRWVLDAIGIHTLSNVGIATTEAGVALAVGGNAIFGGTGIVTATEFHGTFIGPGGEIGVGAGGTWAVSDNNFWPEITGIHTSKNVGIGSTLPGVKLDVHGDVNITGITTFGGAVDLDNTVVDIHGLVGTARSVLTSTGAGVSWGKGGSGVTISESPPVGAYHGDLWWESDTGELVMYYSDGSSDQWITVSQGPIGFQGVQGAPGTGAQGVQGAQGHQGAIGHQGHQSNVAGVQGHQGDRGHQGHQSNVAGAQGVPGVQGAQGRQGAQGAQGYQGHQGIQGAQGFQGAIGHQGHQSNVAGAQGVQGATGGGPQGVPGVQGATGHQGHNGNVGAQGAPGTGVQGARGHQGHNGNVGAQGAMGHQGISGGTGAFTSLSDTPNSLTARKYLRVNSTGNALAYRNSGLGDGYVNAADYGLNASAVDGTNVTAINSAITALGVNGGTIFFPGGMFYLNGAISLLRTDNESTNENGIRFVGTAQNFGGNGDDGGTVLRRNADDEFFNITNSRSIHFINITFKGGAATSSGGNSGITGGNGAIYVIGNPGCSNHLIENCTFHGIANCIHWRGVSDSIIRACRFRRPPANHSGCTFIKLDENSSNNERMDQIRIQDCVADGSPDGTVLNSNVDGIGIYGECTTVFITNTSAIRLKRSYYTNTDWVGNFLYFQNSEAERAYNDGFSINGTGNFITIDNCFSSTNGALSGVDGHTGSRVDSHGINIGTQQNSSVNITNCNVRDNTGHGILIDGNGINNCSIVNPAIGGNSKTPSGTNPNNHGIVIGSNSNNVYIAGGKIGGSAGELSGTGTQKRGIQINGSTHSNIRIIGTNVTGNQESEGISQAISSGTGNSFQFNAGSTTAIDT